MKINHQREATRSPVSNEPAAAPVRHSSLGISHSPGASRLGMALVITLIMLSVTLIMAIAFLAISRRERISVSSSTDGTVARFASDTALAAAQSQILANILSTNAALSGYNLFVSTNYINSVGFVQGSASPTNVNFDRTVTSAAFTIGDRIQDIANLLILPRAPVMVSGTDTNGRFYLDLNRNGAFEDTGTLPFSVDKNGVIDANPFPNAIGDPQWVGVLERPGQPHAADNQFVSRYAFIALPVGESLDLNYIHNYAKAQSASGAGPLMPTGSDSFYRNQGVGSWELNLAAFLADLNTNVWPGYNYALNVGSGLPDLSLANGGNAFNDALALLRYRYAANYSSPAIPSANLLFVNANNVWPNDNIDEYSDGPLQFTTTNLVESFQPDLTARPWPGADNPSRFFSLSDLFDRTKTQAGVTPPTFGFSDWLNYAGTNIYNPNPNQIVSTYDRYTFYRMLDQLGTDSLPDAPGKLNLNYSNAVVNYDSFGRFVSTTIIPGAEMNLTPWIPTNFFCAAADQMLKVYTTNWFQTGPSNYLVTYYGINYTWPIDRYTGFGLTNVPFFGLTNQVPAFGLTNIPVQVNGNYVYSPAVNRILQLAANIYDAGTNDFYPHVFRPDFLVFNQNGFRNTFIIGYDEVSSLTTLNADAPTSIKSGNAPLDQPVDLQVLSLGITSGLRTPLANVYGVPWIIGAKKFMPNFNQFYSFNTAQVTRKLQFSRTSAPLAWSGSDKANYTTNQMLNLSITNHIGFSFWNSYAANYPGQPYVFAQDFITMRLSDPSFPGWSPYTTNHSFIFTSNPNPWTGSGWDNSQTPASRQAKGGSFIGGLFDFPFVHEASLDLDVNGNPEGTGFKSETFVGAPVTTPPFPNYEEDTTNRFQAVILDNGHVLDYVQFYGPVQVRNLGNDVSDPNYNGGAGLPMWSTNPSGPGTSPKGANWGVQNQIVGSMNGGVGLPANAWRDPPNMPSGLQGNNVAEGNMFGGFFTLNWGYGTGTYQNTNLVQQAPYTPTRTIVSPTLWVVNDPLVHNLSSDLTEPVAELNNVTNGVAKSDDPSVSPVPYPSLNVVSDRYQPWGRNNLLNGVTGVLHDDPDNASYNLAYRDPLVWGSDNWDFPTNKYPSVGWLGRVHRGTPWQTVYLKSTNLLDYVDATQSQHPLVGVTTWYNWTGNFNDFDAGNSKPVQDELLFDVFTAAPNANASRGTLSVNQKHPAAWSAVLSGLVVITNITASPNFQFPPVYTNVISGPAGVDLVDSPVWQIVNGPNGINAMRSILYPGGGFAHVGDILRVPVLTDQSPFLNRADPVNLQYDLSDEAYEWLPEQIMGLLRPTGPPRYVIYSWGQTLKPDPNGTSLSAGSFFGLVTNYQVVAESATRAVVTVLPVVTNGVINGVTVPMTNYNMKVENFNVLPPD